MSGHHWHRCAVPRNPRTGLLESPPPASDVTAYAIRGHAGTVRVERIRTTALALESPLIHTTRAAAEADMLARYGVRA